MFEKTLRFFIDNYKINYALFLLLMALGTYAYTQIPKEVSPTIEPVITSYSIHYTKLYESSTAIWFHSTPLK